MRLRSIGCGRASESGSHAPRRVAPAYDSIVDALLGVHALGQLSTDACSIRGGGVGAGGPAWGLGRLGGDHTERAGAGGVLCAAAAPSAAARQTCCLRRGQAQRPTWVAGAHDITHQGALVEHLHQHHPARCLLSCRTSTPAAGCVQGGAACTQGCLVLGRLLRVCQRNGELYVRREVRPRHRCWCPGAHPGSAPGWWSPRACVTLGDCRSG